MVIWPKLIIFTVFRQVEVNGISHDVRKAQNKLVCDCGDDIFQGIPCRHLIAVANKALNNDFSALHFQERWAKSYFNLNDIQKDRIEITNQDSIVEEEEVSLFQIFVHYYQKLFKNPQKIRGPGRPASTSQRKKSLVEKKGVKRKDPANREIGHSEKQTGSNCTGKRIKKMK